MSDKPKWEKYGEEKKPTMKRRCTEHDYYDRSIYMITMATEGRRQLFGQIEGNSNGRTANSNGRTASNGRTVCGGSVYCATSAVSRHPLATHGRRARSRHPLGA